MLNQYRRIALYCLAFWVSSNAGAQANDNSASALASYLPFIFVGVLLAFLCGAGLVYFLLKKYVQDETTDQSLPSAAQAKLVEGSNTAHSTITPPEFARPRGKIIPSEKEWKAGSNDRGSDERREFLSVLSARLKSLRPSRPVIISASAVLVAGFAVLAYFTIPSADNELRASKSAFDKSDFDAALLHIDRAIEFDPKRNDLHVMRGRILTQSGRGQDAVQELNQVLGTEPLNPEALFYRAESFSVLQDYPKAIDDYQTLLKKNERVLDCNISLGRLYLKMHDLDKALSYSQNALQLSPGNAMALWNFGQIYREKTDYPKAISYLNDALQADKNLPIYADRGYCYLKLGQNQKAEQDLKAAKDKNSSDLDNIQNLALAYDTLGKYADGIDEITIAIGRDSSNKTYKQTMKMLCEHLLSKSKQTLLVNPNDSTAHADLALALYNMQDYANSLKEAVTAIRLDRNNYRNFFIAASCQLQAKKHGDAVRLFQECLALKPNYHHARFELARALSAEGQVQQAIGEYRRLVSENYSVGNCYRNIGLEYFDLREYSNAIANLQTSLQHEPDDAITWEYLGDSYDHTNEVQKATDCYKQCLKLNPKMSEIYTDLSDQLLQQGDWAGALETLERLKLVRADYLTGGYLIDRAFIYAAKGDYTKARDDMKQSIELEQSSGAYQLDGYLAVAAGDKSRIEYDVKGLLELSANWKNDSYGPLAIYILQNFNNQKSSAQTFIENVDSKIKGDEWPAPLIHLYANKISKQDFMQKYEQRTGIDPSLFKIYVGVHDYLAGDLDSARKNFEWVKSSGRRTWVEYSLVLALMRKHNWA